MAKAYIITSYLKNQKFQKKVGVDINIHATKSKEASLKMLQLK